MPSAWEPDTGNVNWGDREAWRGNLHPDDAESWRDDAGDDVGEDAALSADGDDIDEHEAGWPEDLAGPEYWLFKRDCDE
jgi:FAD/FMN-containing dehydrogenase